LELGQNGIDMAVVWAMRQSDDYIAANRYITNAAKANSDRLVAFARLNPWLADSAAKLQKAVKIDGAKGLKLHPTDECFDADDSIVHPLLEVAEKERIPVVFHSGVTARPAIIGMAADRFPNVKMVLAHLGTILYDDCMFVAKKCDNVYLETSQCPFLHRIGRTVVRKVGIDRVIWGSDVPYHFQEIEKRKYLGVIGIK
jgi:predicted TIM-barrel fold metal-dependent hydrolase